MNRKNTATKVTLFSTDNDHTMMGYFAGAVPAWREALPLIANVLGLSVDEVGVRLGTEFALAATHDYPWSLALAFGKDWKGSVAEFVQKVERPFWDLQDKYRLLYVKPYDGVIDTLQKIRCMGIPIVCVSDAPYHMALARHVGGGLGRLIDGVYALDFPRPDVSRVPSEEWLAFGDERVARLEAEYGVNHSFKFMRKMSVHFEKPDPRGIQLAMSDFGITDSAGVVHVGDSLPKDIKLGETAKLGATLYTPWHAINNLPGEYKHMITHTLRADPSRLGSSPKTTVATVPDNHGAFAEVLNLLTHAVQVEEVSDNYRA